MINKDFKDNVTLINVIPLIIIPIGKDYSKIMFFYRFINIVSMHNIRNWYAV